MNRFARHLIFTATGSAALLTLSAVEGALAQNVTIYAPVQNQYSLGDFAYKGPSGDGWRQVATTGNTLILVYAETVDGTEIHTRAQIDLEAFAANPDDLRGDVLWLTEQSHAQQIKERGDKLVAFSKIGPIASSPKTMSYALVTRITEGEDLYETFYVTVSGDKTSYLVAKLTTKDSDHRTRPYFEQFETSLASLVHESGKKPSGDSQPMPNGGDASGE